MQDNKNTNTLKTENKTTVIETQKTSNNILKIGSVKNLLTTATITSQAIKSSTNEKEDLEIKPTIDPIDTIETELTIEKKLTPTIVEIEQNQKEAEFVPFDQISLPPMEYKEHTNIVPKNVSTWFVNNLSNYMNGLPIEKEDDFHTLMTKLSEDENLNPQPSHIGLHKIKHFIKTKMSHMFDTTRDEFLTFNLTQLDKGVMLIGPTPDNNIVLAGNLSSLENSDWETLKNSLEAQID